MIDGLIELIGRDGFVFLVLFIGCIIRSGSKEKKKVAEGLISAFVPFFVVLCLLLIFEYGLSLLGMELPGKVLAAAGGIGGFLGNSWIIGLQKNGKAIEEEGALQSLGTLIKGTVNFKKTE